MPSAFRARLLLWWGSLHIGEVIRRRALRRVLRNNVALRVGATPSRSPSVVEGEKTFRVLDAGCGRGDNALWFARRYPHAAVVAVDIDPALVEAVRRRAVGVGLRNVSVQQADIENSSLVTHPSSLPYGIVWSVDVFEHLRDPQAAVRSLAAALAPGGTLLIHVPRARQRRFFRRFEHYEQHDHERDGFEPEELATFMRTAGLAVETIQHTFGPPGALAWELFHLAQGVGKWLALLTYPIPWIFAWADSAFRWKRGNGMLIVARKFKTLNSKP
ncbi:class I SAM-dependent methyltransferase [Candidatus Uhrbacteria bacterium]|nr:class I SAM-dependent methyltransferase [Candidatus Uhrbacteria bacterium]